MSAEAVGWTFRRSPYKGDQRVIHLALADATDDMHGDTFRVTVAAIAEKSLTSERTVQYTLADMKARGYLEQVEAGGGRGRPAMYRFLMPRGETVQDLHPSETVQPQEVSQALESSQELAPCTVSDFTLSARTAAPPPRPVMASSGAVATATRTRPRNEIWDAVVEVCGIDSSGLTATGKTNVGKAVRELKEVGATPDEIRRRARVYRERFRGADLTANALLKHWASLASASGPDRPGYNPHTAWMYE